MFCCIGIHHTFLNRTNVPLFSISIALYAEKIYPEIVLTVENAEQIAYNRDMCKNGDSMQNDKVDIEQLLKEGCTIQIKPQGYSMYPVFVPGRDEAIVEPVEDKKLKRGDVVLYRRDLDVEFGGILVLHRIWKVKEEGIFLVGDNQKEIEGPLRKDQIKGVMIALVRKGRTISVKNVLYRFFTGIWLWVRPFRPTISKMAAGIKKRVRPTKR